MAQIVSRVFESEGETHAAQRCGVNWVRPPTPRGENIWYLKDNLVRSVSSLVSCCAGCAQRHGDTHASCLPGDCSLAPPRVPSRG